VDFNQNCGAAKVNVIVHSMGNRGLLRALSLFDLLTLRETARLRRPPSLRLAPLSVATQWRGKATLFSNRAKRTIEGM
jgi:hypothetical protein